MEAIATPLRLANYREPFGKGQVAPKPQAATVKTYPDLPMEQTSSIMEKKKLPWTGEQNW